MNVFVYYHLPGFASVIATAAGVLIVATNELLNPDGFSDDVEKYASLVGVVVISGALPLFTLVPAVRHLVTIRRFAGRRGPPTRNVMKSV